MIQIIGKTENYRFGQFFISAAAIFYFLLFFVSIFVEICEIWKYF